jgi:hypothetical protein
MNAINVAILGGILSLHPLAFSQDTNSIFNSALSQGGLSTQTARFDSGLLSLFRQGEFTTPAYAALHSNPWELPKFGQIRMKESLGAAARPSVLFNQLANQAGFGTRRALLGNPIQYAIDFSKRPGALTAVLNQMRKDGMIKTAVPSIASIPDSVQQAAAVVLTVGLKSVELRRLCFVDISDNKRLFGLSARNSVSDTDYTTQMELYRSYKKLNLNYMSAAAHDIALAAEYAQEVLANVPNSSKYSLRIRTTWGLIRLNGAGSDGYDDEPSFLTIDTGGDDVYINGPSNTSVENWVSVSIDTDGDDQYLSDRELAKQSVVQYTGRKRGDRPGPGGAVMGVSVLIDTKGNDLYRSHRPGIGAGALGFGALVDLSGNDTYDAYTDAQGHGRMGVGVLSDLAGNDKYTGFNEIQGVGAANGAGMLIDVSGDDEYVANDDVLDFPSAQTTQHNLSMAQGAGVGRRADYLDGLSYAGGVGLLVDGNGNDQYRAGVFAQGVGYWSGVGMLLDQAGDDQYSAVWYAQGASAHFSVGFLGEFGGSDRYTATSNTAQGAGHDFGVGALYDAEGDDKHVAPNLSLGAGSANGIGWFMDLTGNDTYKGDGVTLGRSAELQPGSLREMALMLGVFIDAGGKDSYDSLSIYPGANTSKVNRLTENQLGIFVDRS